MRRSTPILVSVIMLAHAAYAQAEQVKVSIEYVDVEGSKADGRPWDGMGGPPDIVLKLALGVGDEAQCDRQVEVERLGPYKNRYKATISHQEAVEVPKGQGLCLEAMIFDKDAMNNDPIGRGRASLMEGVQAIRLGQATLQLSVEYPQAKAAEPTRRVVLPDPPSKPQKAWLLTVVSAEVTAKRPDGSTWDEAHDQEAEDAAVLKTIIKAGYATVIGDVPAGLSAVAGLLGLSGSAAPTHRAQTNSAPDPFVEVSVGESTFSGQVQRNTFAPEWNSTFVVYGTPLPPPTIKLSVLDGDGGANEAIGSDVFPLPPMLVQGVAKPKFGSVGRVTIMAQQVELSDQPQQTRLTLAAGDLIADTGVDLHGGQLIRITAQGEHCIRGRCMGPDGDAERPRRFDNLQLNEGQLVAFVGTEAVPIGAGQQFNAPRDGTLYIGLLSREASSGKLDVEVTVFHPISR